MPEVKNGDGGMAKDKKSKRIWRLQDDKRVLKCQLDEKEDELKELRRRVKAKVKYPDGTEAKFLQQLVAKYWNAVVVPLQFIDSLELTLLTLQQEFYDIVNMVKLGHTIHIKEFVKAVRKLVANLLNCPHPEFKSLTVQAAMQLSLFVNQVQAFSKSCRESGDLKMEDFEEENRILIPEVVVDRTLSLQHRFMSSEHTESYSTSRSTSESSNPGRNVSVHLIELFLKVLEKLKECDHTCFLTSGEEDARGHKKRREAIKMIRQSYKAIVVNVSKDKYDNFLKFETKLLQLVERLNQFEVKFNCQQAGHLAVSLKTIITDSRLVSIPDTERSLASLEVANALDATNEGGAGQIADELLPRRIDSCPVSEKSPSSLDIEAVEFVSTKQTLNKNGLRRFLNILKAEFVSRHVEEFVNLLPTFLANVPNSKPAKLAVKAHIFSKKFESHEGFMSYKDFAIEAKQLSSDLVKFGTRYKHAGAVRLSSSLSNMLIVGQKEFDWKPNLLQELEDDIFFKSYRSNTIVIKPDTVLGSSSNSTSHPLTSKPLTGYHQVANVPVHVYVPYLAIQSYPDPTHCLNQFIRSLVQRYLTVYAEIFCSPTVQIGRNRYIELSLKYHKSEEMIQFVRLSILSMQSGKYVAYWQFEKDVGELKCTLVNFMTLCNAKRNVAFSLYQSLTAMMVAGCQEFGSYTSVLNSIDTCLVYSYPFNVAHNVLVCSL